MTAFAIKAHIADAKAATFDFAAHKTMYGGRTIAAGDVIFLFGSGNGGGSGLAARGVVIAAKAHVRPAAGERWTPRVSIAVERTAIATRPLGRSELKVYNHWDDGRPETELNFKFYRQATDKIVAISEATARYLDGFF